MNYTVHGILQARILEWVAIPFSRRSSSGIEPRSLTLQEDSLPAELLGKPKYTGVGSLSLLQGILATQESNQGLLHCRQILYQLSYVASCVIFGPSVREVSLSIALVSTEVSPWYLREVMPISPEQHG